MSPDILATAPSVINSFQQSGGILGLIILALLLIVGLVAFMGWKFMTALMLNHEKRMDAQETRHQVERTTANIQWQRVTREITADMKTALNTISQQQAGVASTVERIDRSVEVLKRRRAA